MAKKDRVKPAFRRVFDHFEGPLDLAIATGESKQCVDYWLRIGFVPPVHALAVSMATGGKVSHVDLLMEAKREIERRRALREHERAQLKKAAAGSGEGQAA